MLLLALILLPLLGGLLTYLARSRPIQNGVLLLTALAHLAGVWWIWGHQSATAFGGWLAVDALGLLVLSVISLLFLAIGSYVGKFLELDGLGGGRLFHTCLLSFLAAATLVSLAHHLALVWIGMEATTLALAPLVFYRQDRRSLEAVWKYLVLSSVGIGLALLGTFFLASAQVQGRPLVLEDLLQFAGTLQPALLRGAFVFLLVGYGTKMGLAPLHAWKPDTYGEAPSLVGGLMAGALTSCAFLGLARIVEVMAAAGQTAFMRPPLLALGITSLVVSAAFIIGQTDMKRMLAYSSVEHMGILVLALAIGGVGSYGAMIHLIGNGLSKGLLFLAVGNVALLYRTSEAGLIRGVLRRAPWTGGLLLVGLFAVTGSPPFVLFVSEITILGAAIHGGLIWLAVGVMVLFAIIFVGMAKMILDMAWGEPIEPVTPMRESRALVAGPLALGIVVLILGLYLPEPLRVVLGEAARALGGVATMSRFDALGLRNRRAIALDSIAQEPMDRFRQSVGDALLNGWRLAAFFGMPDAHGAIRLLAILANDQRGELGATSTLVVDHYPALTPDWPEAHYFEREIAEQCGVIPLGHPELKPVRRHPPDHASRPRNDDAFDREANVFSHIESSDVHEVAVGPVHAGIIEPGHFRFQAFGEEVLQLEIMLGYQHRGVERLLEDLPRDRAVLVAESIAGDTVIGHAGVYCSAIEALARSRKTPRAQAIRGIALELERLANHIGDLGTIAGDIAYQPAAAYFGRMRGECLNLLMTLSGNRYGRGLVRPGGTLFDIPPEMAAEMIDRSQRLRNELVPVAELMFASASVQARLEGVGKLLPAVALELGVVGPMARACDIPRDVRHDHPYGLFRFAHIPVARAWAGDALARALVRWIEIQRSLDFVIEQVASLPKGEIRVACGELHLAEIVVAMSEGWRGEIVHVVVTDDRGHVRRHKVIDPSFHNWRAVAAVMPGNQISDFPLCNKSFNLSYAGHDL